MDLRKADLSDRYRCKCKGCGKIMNPAKEDVMKDFDSMGLVYYCAPCANWERNEIQFPRLLAEIRAIGLTSEQYADLIVATDLTVTDIDELFERAEAVWNKIKEVK